MKSLISVLAVASLIASPITSGILTTHDHKTISYSQVNQPVAPIYNYKFIPNSSLVMGSHSPRVYPLLNGRYILYINETLKNDYLVIGALQKDGTYKFTEQTVPADFIARDLIIAASATKDMSKILLGTNGGQWICNRQANGIYTITKINPPSGLNPKTYVSTGCHISADGSKIYLLYDGYNTPLSYHWGGLAVGTLQANNTYQYKVYLPRQFGTNNNGFSSLTVSPSGEVVVTVAYDYYDMLNGGLYIGTPDQTGNLTFSAANIPSKSPNIDPYFANISNNSEIITAFDSGSNDDLIYGIKGANNSYKFYTQIDPQLKSVVATQFGFDDSDPIVAAVNKTEINTGIYDAQTHQFVFGAPHQFYKPGTFSFINSFTIAQDASHIYVSGTDGVFFGSKQS